MKDACDFTAARMLDQITDLIYDVPKLQLSLYLLRDAALRLNGCALSNDGAALLRKMLRKARDCAFDSMVNDCHEALYILCTGIPIYEEDMLADRAEALRCFRKYMERISPYCDSEETNRLRAMKKLLEEDFNQALICARMKRTAAVLKKRAQLGQERIRLTPDRVESDEGINEIECRRALMRQKEEDFQLFLQKATEIPSEDALMNRKAIENNDATGINRDPTIMECDENV